MTKLMKTFLLEIITPDRIAFSDQVEMVTVPSEAGILGILPDHAPLLSKLTSGELKIIKDGQETFISLGEGFMQISQGKVSILVTKALHADEIDEVKLLAAKKDAEQIMKNPPTKEAIVAAQSALKGFLSDLKVVRRRHQPQITP